MPWKEQQPNEAPPEKKKRNETFSPEDRAEIGRFAADNGNAAAVRKYSVGENTARLLKYLATLRAQGSEFRRSYVRALRDAVGSIGSSIVIAT